MIFNLKSINFVRYESVKINKICYSVLVALVAFPAIADNNKNIETMTVTASRNQKDKLAIPETVDVVTKKNIDEHHISTMQDLVRYMPGVSVERQTSGTDPFGNLGGIRIRGVSRNRVKCRLMAHELLKVCKMVIVILLIFLR